MIPLPSLTFAGGSAGPSEALSSAPTDVEVSAPFTESAFDVGGTQYSYPGQPVDASISTQTSGGTSLPSWALYAGAGLLAFVLFHHHALPR